MPTLALAEEPAPPTGEGLADATPWQLLALRVALVLNKAGIPAVNIYSTPPQQLAIPAIVIAPGEPWMLENSDEEPFTRFREQYMITALAAAAAPADSIAWLHSIIVAMIDGIDTRGWWWIGVSGLQRVDSGGGQFLGVTMRVGHSVENSPVRAQPKTEAN